MNQTKRKLVIAVPSRQNPFTAALIKNGFLPVNCRRYVIDSGPPDGVMTIHFDCYVDDRIYDAPVIKALRSMKAIMRRKAKRV